ncbi:hypothetical protein ACIBK9_18750 [Nonomuraea sp. NPDC050227]|uniref:hypothetical protein n=1 Tax=Nonomuraea sp. NPDC050227 TaxID=3364360 RepID=UPI00378F8AC0
MFSGVASRCDATCAPDPITPYGAAKATAETAVNALQPAAVIVRTSWSSSRASGAVHRPARWTGRGQVAFGLVRRHLRAGLGRCAFGLGHDAAAASDQAARGARQFPGETGAAWLSGGMFHLR